jgi:hypothetical protein
MSKIKEIAEKSEGRVIIASLPKAEPTEKGQESTIQTAPEKPKEKHQEKQQKTLVEMQADFERLKNLFNRKTRFENALVKLKDYSDSIKKTGGDIESDDFKLILGSGYNREDIKISNKEVINECVKFLQARVASTVETIENEIVNS